MGMLENSVENVIIQIINNNLEISQKMKSDSPLKELGINSITFIKIIIEIENEFDIEFEDDKLDFKKFSTVQSIMDYVKNRLS